MISEYNDLVLLTIFTKL